MQKLQAVQTKRQLQKQAQKATHQLQKQLHQAKILVVRPQAVNLRLQEVSTMSKTATSISKSVAISVSGVANAGITYAGGDTGAIEIRNNINNINNSNIPNGNNFFSTKTDAGDKLKEQEQKFYNNVEKSMNEYAPKNENKPEKSASPSNSNFTTKIKVSEEYSSKKETKIDNFAPLNNSKKYTYDPLNWVSELKENVKSKTSKLSPNMSEEVRERLENALIQKEKKELQKKYSTEYNASDNWLNSTMSKITGNPNVHETLEPLFEESDGTKKNTYLSAFASGAKDGFNFGLVNEVAEAATSAKIVSKTSNKIGNIIKKNDDELKTIVQNSSKNLDEAKEIEVAAKSGIEGGSTLIRLANPNEIRFSQSSVNGLDDIAASMKKNGWVGDPIDVVRMSDGKFTTIDNTRVLAAREAGIDVKMIVHEADEALPSNFVDRFTTKKGVPTTWEEAVQLRIQKQNSTFKNANPNGAYEMK